MTRKLCIALALLASPAVFAGPSSLYVCKGTVVDDEKESSVDVLPYAEGNPYFFNGTLGKIQFGVTAFEEQPFLHMSIFSREDLSRSARANAIIPTKNGPSLLQMRTQTGSLELKCTLK